MPATLVILTFDLLIGSNYQEDLVIPGCSRNGPEASEHRSCFCMEKSN